MKDAKKRIYVKMADMQNDGIYEWLILVPFGDRDDFMNIIERDGQRLMEVHVDEGYVVTIYYYPMPRYAITCISTY